MREFARDVLVCCRNYRCSHRLTLNADRWANHVRLSDIEQRFVCMRCGKRGVEVRPKFSQPRNGCRLGDVARHQRRA